MMSGHRKWWSGHELYGMNPQDYRFRENFYQDYPYIDLGPQNKEEIQLTYWKSLYPEKIKKVQQKVEETCETMEYANSPMYDEYPDRVYLRKLGNMIYEDLMKEDESLKEMEFSPGMPQGRREAENSSAQLSHERSHGRDSWLRDIVDVLLFQEMHRRRCERGRCGRKWY